MKRNIPLIALILAFLFRIMIPITNSLYFFGELTLGRDGLWKTLYIASLLLEVAAVALLAVGLNVTKTRRMGSLIAMGLSGLHYAAMLIPFIILPAARRFMGPVYMIVLTVMAAVTLGLAYLTLRSADEPETATPLTHKEVPHEAP